jgi:uncharacterized protein (TIGR02246 family)
MVALTLALCGGEAAFAADENEAERLETAIRQATAEFAAAFNRSDAEAMAAAWTEHGDYLGAGAKPLPFREQILARLEEGKNSVKHSLTLTVDAVRAINKDVALADGVSVLKIGDARPVHARYSAVWVLQKDRWVIDSFRESLVGPGSHHAHLTELAWMIGQWTGKSDTASVETSVAWSEDGNFLIREFRVTSAGRGDHSGTQRIGWDPLAGKFKSWIFLNDGSYGEGDWDADGNAWIIRSTSVVADGKLARSTTRLTRESDNEVLWESVNATLDDRREPDLKMRLTRQN